MSVHPGRRCSLETWFIFSRKMTFSSHYRQNPSIFFPSANSLAWPISFCFKFLLQLLCQAYRCMIILTSLQAGGHDLVHSRMQFSGMAHSSHDLQWGELRTWSPADFLVSAIALLSQIHISSSMVSEICFSWWPQRRWPHEATDNWKSPDLLWTYSRRWGLL